MATCIDISHVYVFALCRFCFIRMLQMFLQHVHDNSNSCLNVIHQFSVFPHSLSNLWLEQSSVRLVQLVQSLSSQMRLLLYLASFLLKFEIYENIHTKYFEDLFKIPCWSYFYSFYLWNLKFYILQLATSFVSFVSDNPVG